MLRIVLLIAAFAHVVCDTRDLPQLTARSARLERPEKLADPAYPSATVFAPNMQGITCFRIPSVIQLPDGTLMAFAEARRGSCGDGDSHEIASRSSKDGGQSWSELKIAAGNETYWVGNPEVVVRSDGTLLMLVALHGKGCTGNCVTGNAVVTSADGGVTWEAPRDITAAMGPAAKARTGPGTALLLKSGPAKGTFDHSY
jgi:sialidase-1